MHHYLTRLRLGLPLALSFPRLNCLLEFSSVKGRGRGKGDKEKITTSDDDPAKDEDGVNKVTNNCSLLNVNLDQNISPSVDMFEASYRNSNRVTKGDDVNSNANVEPTASASRLSASVLFATLLKGYTNPKSVNFRALITPTGNGADVVVSLESIRVDSDVNLLKEDVGNVLVWVKLHDVRMTAFSEDGLSVIVTKLGTPFMFDSYTYDMCMQSLGRSSYARVMIELRADVELKDTIVVFGHVLNECPNKIVLDVVKNLNNPRQATRGFPVGPKGNMDNDSKVEVVFDETVNLMASTSFKCGSDRGHGTNSLLENG
ncbi:hypothetical protein Tco_0706844 [Tanacetum coccineum]|uniref:DUF4283 domain-containing protein n=1 Tax=Tanacetum coccineum TaxID=301880 RepID=A0ABQ4YA51_9ASTR